MAKKQSTAAELDATADEALTFEQAYDELQKIVIQLEQGDLPLEQSMTLHARGQTLVVFCSKLLDAADLRVRQIDTAG
jgi:exodeoxyribonuclease VII small subunit